MRVQSRKARPDACPNSTTKPDHRQKKMNELNVQLLQSKKLWVLRVAKHSVDLVKDIFRLAK